LWSHCIHARSLEHRHNADVIRDTMDEEDELDLKPDQWETLRALRAPATTSSAWNLRVVIEDLLALGLVTIDGQLPAITPKGRKALIRGSFRLWDVTA
jgi:hypothetical protein